jgi:hypothetical protein
MKRMAVLISLLIIVVVASACTSAVEQEETPAGPSQFLEEFSLGLIIDETEESYLETKGSITGYLDPASTLAGDEVSSTAEAFYQKHEVAIIPVDPANQNSFMEAVKSMIEASVTSSGATIRGRGVHSQNTENAPANELTHFSFRYADGAAGGVVNVWGVPGEGNTFHLIVLIVEQ